MNVSMNTNEDPLGLRRLDPLVPAVDEKEHDWDVVKAALERTRARRRRNWLASTIGLAASIALAFVLYFRPTLLQPEDPAQLTSFPDRDGSIPSASVQSEPADPIKQSDLIAMSQGMERQLRILRNQVGSMPTEMVAYQVELQDLIGQVDDALGLDLDASELWAQRVSLQLDLIKLYRNQLRRDYARYASL